ncbi:MAG TPA: hypothetical protein VGV87_31725 [Blastocatellia bacterium]|nr:hypothetical protein [Blastocatellia bacterium]
MFKKSALIIALISTSLGGFIIGQRGTHADSYAEGRVIILPSDYKLVNVLYQGKVPMALVRPMREGEKPETWVLKSLNEMDGDEARLGAEPAVVVRESTLYVAK